MVKVQNRDIVDTGRIIFVRSKASSKDSWRVYVSRTLRWSMSIELAAMAHFCLRSHAQTTLDDGR